MALKDLFIKKDENASDKPKETPKVTQTKFPTTEKPETETSVFNFGFGKTSNTPTFNPQSNAVSSETVAKTLEIYQNGLANLNQQPGYDFYEFYIGLSEEDRGNNVAYGIAFRMANAMDKSITKDKLVQQADFYVGKIIEQYNSFVTGGNNKKEEIIGQKTNENQALTNELDNLKQQFEAIKFQIQDRENKINAIDGKYQPKISEIESKLAANDIAKDTIVKSIEQVKQGIINNLK